MLTEKEALYVTEFLTALPEHSVQSVAHTVSGGMLDPENKGAAIKIIIQHSENPEKILSRKLISKQYLFSYLHWRNVSVSQSLNKNALVQKILTLWQDTPYQSRAPMPENYQASYTQNGSSQALSGQNDQQGSVSYTALGSMNSDNRYHQNAEVTGLYHNQSCGNNAVVSNSFSNSSSGVDYNLVLRNENTVSNTINQNSVGNTSHPANQFSVEELALKFSEWFYGLVNKTEYISSNPSESDLGPQHFWQDASIQISLHSECEVSSHTAMSGVEVSELILNIKTQHNLFFNPNLSHDGVRGKSERHGMAVIVACGTLHRGVGQFVGVFEQMFYLLRDPLCSNNWKIKHSQLILRSRNMNALEPPPTLNDSELAHSLQMKALT
ncbi:unnamed protein product [Bemisia tabaci]|uniref:NTF2 domain-containing protein n=1 Tax=Bemisia tabaci TaxID=7038 RepID=A0A9N9ZZX9_BEMTA|nr:unnamed protein product [Bemisia tabaci]